MIVQSVLPLVPLLAVPASLRMVAVAEPPMSATLCPTKPIQCCESVKPSNDTAVNVLLELLGVPITGTTLPIGLHCVPIPVCAYFLRGITVLSTFLQEFGTGSTCSAQAVCCYDNSFTMLLLSVVLLSVLTICEQPLDGLVATSCHSVTFP